MKVRELIAELTNYSMDAEVDFDIIDPDFDPREDGLELHEIQKTGYRQFPGPRQACAKTRVAYYRHRSRSGSTANGER